MPVPKHAGIHAGILLLHLSSHQGSDSNCAIIKFLRITLSESILGSCAWDPLPCRGLDLTALGYCNWLEWVNARLYLAARWNVSQWRYHKMYIYFFSDSRCLQACGSFSLLSEEKKYLKKLLPLSAQRRLIGLVLLQQAELNWVILMIDLRDYRLKMSWNLHD